MSSRLNPDDQKRVEQYLSAPQHQVERQPFRVWRLLLVILIFLVGAIGIYPGPWLEIVRPAAEAWAAGLAR